MGTGGYIFIYSIYLFNLFSIANRDVLPVLSTVYPETLVGFEG